MKRLLLGVLILAAGVPALAVNRGQQGSVPSSSLGVSVPGTGGVVPVLPASSIGSPSSFGLPGVNAGVSLPSASIGRGAAAGASLGSNDAKGPAALPGTQASGAQAVAGQADKNDEGKASGTNSADDEFSSSAQPLGEAQDSAKDQTTDKKDAKAEVSDETAKIEGDAKFDGSAAKKSDAPIVEAPKTFAGKILARMGLGKFTPQQGKVKTAFDRDEFGGPQRVTLTAGGKVKEGLKWGLTLTGIATLLQVGLGMFFAKVFPWQLHVSKSFLEGTGRVELLTGMGPHGIVEAVVSNPILFFTMQMPLMTLKEELVFRGLQFALYFFMFAAMKPAAALITKFLEKVPDLFSLRSVTTRILGWAAKLSGRAFGLAAVLTAWSFATAHFSNWGFDPVTIAVHATLGFALSYLAYKTRSLATAFLAHFTYNALSVAGVLVALMFGLPGALIYTLGLGVVSVTAAFLHWRSYVKAKRLAGAQARLNIPTGIAGLLVLALMVGSLTGLAPRNASQQAAMSKTPIGWVMPAQQPDPKQQPPQAPLDSLKAPTDSLPPEVKEALLNFQKSMGIKTLEPQRELAPLAALTAKAKGATVMVMNPGNGLGSGFVISKDGLLFTNAHVVDGARNGIVSIKFENGLQGQAKVVAVNYDKDIALIQLPKNPAGDWDYIELAAGAPMEGDEVIALGHPRGLPFTVTRGIVSGVGARGNLYVEHVQTDAAINPGNSGGPLVDANTGKVVGMNTQIMTADGGSNGLGFAITAKSLQAALDQYRTTGNINSSWLGIIVNIGGENDGQPGVLVEVVRPGSPAEAAGLKSGDVILGANGQTFADPEASLLQLATIIAKTKPGQPLVIATARDGDITIGKVTLADKK